MIEIIKLIVEFVNSLHDIIMLMSMEFGMDLSDKELHFWVIGVIGILNFGFTHSAFKLISKWSITLISFIYTLTVLVVIVFAIEIQQRITGRGNMEFADIKIGLYGFLFFFGIYLVFKLFIKLIKAKVKNK